MSENHGYLSKHAQKWASVSVNEQAYLRVDSVLILSKLAPNEMGLHKNESNLLLIEQVCSKMSEFVQVYATFLNIRRIFSQLPLHQML